MNFLSKWFDKNKKTDKKNIIKPKITTTEKINTEPNAVDNADPIESFLVRLKSDPTLFSFDIVTALAEINNHHAMEALIAALHSDDIKIRNKTISAVDSIANSRFLASIKPDYKDWDNDPAIQASVEIGDDRVVEVLISALQDEAIDANTRKSAVNALGTLGQTGDKRAVEPLIAALKDEAWSVRFQAADCLVKIYKDGKLDETHSRLIEDKKPTIKSVLPSDRIQNLRKNGLWPF